MKEEKDKRKYFNEYLEEAKYDLIVRVFLFIILIIIYVIFKIQIIPELLVFFFFWILIYIYGFIATYINLLLIKNKFIPSGEENNLQVDYWNESNLMFVKDCIFAKNYFQTLKIDYKDINKVKINLFKGHISSPVIRFTFYLNNNKKYYFIVCRNDYVKINYKIIVKYLKEKNSNIEFVDKIPHNFT